MSSKALHVEIEVGAVLGFHVAGKDVVVDADAFAVGEGYGDDGLGTGVFLLSILLNCEIITQE